MNRASLILLATFLTTLHIHPMDTPMDIEKNESPQQLICYLTMLDPHIWPLIAQYLTFDIESEEEFIARTKTTIKKKIPEKYYYKDFKIPSTSSFPGILADGFSGTMSILTAFCPNAINIASLDENNLKIIHTKNDLVIHAQELEKKEYQHIALSGNATMFATIHQERERDRTHNRFDKVGYFLTHHLAIKNITTKTTQTIKLPGNFNPPHKSSYVLLAFNKQGTHIILHGTDHAQAKDMVFALGNDTTQESTPHHLIFPVTVNMVMPANGIISESEIQARNILASQKTLEDYFQQKGICKSIPRRINK